MTSANVFYQISLDNLSSAKMAEVVRISSVEASETSYLIPITLVTSKNNNMIIVFNWLNVLV